MWRGGRSRIAKPGSAVFILSDFYGMDTDSAQEHLYQLSRHTEITCIFCSDPVERQLPASGRYSISDGKNRSTLHTGSAQLRQVYAERFEQRQDNLQRSCSKLGIPVILAGTEEPSFDILHRYYGNQHRRAQVS